MWQGKGDQRTHESRRDEEAKLKNDETWSAKGSHERKEMPTFGGISGLSLIRSISRSAQSSLIFSPSNHLTTSYCCISFVRINLIDSIAIIRRLSGHWVIRVRHGFRVVTSAWNKRKAKGCKTWRGQQLLLQHETHEQVPLGVCLIVSLSHSFLRSVLYPSSGRMFPSQWFLFFFPVWKFISKKREKIGRNWRVFESEGEVH